jgi:carbamoyltransferase
MGMAPYGVPRYQDKVWKLIDVAPDGAFALNLDYFAFHYSSTTTYSRKFEELFGRPRSPETPFFTDSSGYPSYFGDAPSNYRELAADNRITPTSPRVSRWSRRKCCFGWCAASPPAPTRPGYAWPEAWALNSVANGRILRETAITDLYVQPAAGDSGAALGAALFVQHQVLGEPRRFVMEHGIGALLRPPRPYVKPPRQAGSATSNAPTTVRSFRERWIC